MEGARGLQVRLRARAPCFPRSLGQPLPLLGPRVPLSVGHLGPRMLPTQPLLPGGARPPESPWPEGHCPSPGGPSCLFSWPPPRAPVCSHQGVPRRCYLNPSSPSPRLRAELGTQKGSAQRAGAFALANRHPHAMRCPAQQVSPGLGSKDLEPGCSHVHDSQMAPPPPPTPIPLDLSADCAQRPAPALTCPPKGLRPSAGLIAPESWRGQSDANRPRHTPKWDRVC